MVDNPAYPMLLVCALFLASFAGSVLSLIGLISFRRAHSFATAGNVGAGRAALRRARRTMAAGLTTLAVAMPAILFALDTTVPRSHLIFLATVPVAVILVFATVLLVVDLRLQDLLRPTPANAAASSVDDSVTFELTADHLWRSQMQWQVKSRLGRITLAISLLVILPMIIVMPLTTRSLHPGRPLLVYFLPPLFGFCLVVMLVIVFGKQLSVATAGRRPGILCQHTIEVRSDGLREKTHANDTLWQWLDVRDLTETNEYLLLRVRTIGLFAIPKSAFASEEHTRRFVTAIRDRMTARGAAVPTPA